MASFDFVESTSNAYRFLWDRREDVVRLSAMVVVVKILFFVGFVAFGIEQQTLRQGLILLPSYFLEGWVIAQIMVMALYGLEQSGETKTKILPPPEDIETNIKASMIAYVLIKLMLSFVVGFTVAEQQKLPDAPPPEGNMQTFFVVFVMIAFVVWAFRFLWMYVPMVMGRGPMEYLNRFRKMNASFYMMGVWILCFVPLVLVMIFLSEFVGAFLGALSVSEESVLFKSALAIVQAFIDYLMALISSVGIAYGFYSVFVGENKTTPIW